MANAALATAYVQIMPSFDGMRNAIQDELGGSIARQAGDSAGESFGKGFSDKAKTAMAAAGTALAAATAAFAVSSVRAFAEAEAMQSKLNLAYTKFPAIASVSLESYRELNAAIQEKTGTDGDALAAMQATLAVYGVTGQELQSLTPLVNDFSIATGRDLNSAATAIGKALMGNSRALKDIGVDYQSTGDRAADVAAIMDILAAKVGGAGDAFGQTTAGKVKSLQEAFSDLQENVGAALVPALTALVDASKPLLAAFTSLPSGVQAAIVIIGGFGTALVLVLPKLIAFKAQLATLSPTAASAAGSIGKATAALAVVGTAVAIAIPYLEQAKRALDEWSKSVLGIPKPVGIEEATVAMRDFVKASTDAQLAEALRGIGTALAELATDSAADYLRDLQYSLQGITSPTEAAVAQIDQLDAILASLYSSGNTAEAERLWNALVAQAAALGMSVDDLKVKFDQYTAAVASANLNTDGITPPVKEATSGFWLFGDAIESLPAAFDAAAEAGRKYVEQVQQVSAIQADMEDMRFEATLAGLDTVTAATRRLAYEQQQLNALRAEGASMVDVAEQEREVLRAQLALTEAQRVAAEQAAEAARQAREELRRARQAVADAIGGPFVSDLLKGSAQSITSTLRDLVAKIRDAVGGAVASGLADMIERGNDRLVSAAKRRDRIVARLQDAKAKLESLEQSRASLEEQVRSQAYGGLVQFGNQALQPDAEGVAPSASQAAQGIVARLQQRLREIRDFSSNLKKLAGRGLPQQFINELIQAGPIDGGPTARLLANASETDFQSIKSSASTLYTESSNLAKQAGSTMYSTGIQAAQGLVDGLKAKEQAIAAQMTRIAKIMVATIRQALGIRSPSRAFAGVGASIGDGLVVGIADRQGAVRAAVSGLVAVPSAQISATVGASGAAAGGVTSAGGFTVNQLTVNNPAPEPASTSVAAGLRRSAFLLGVPA